MGSPLPVSSTSSLSAVAPCARSPLVGWVHQSRSGGEHCGPVGPGLSWCCPTSSTWLVCFETKPAEHKVDINYNQTRLFCKWTFNRNGCVFAIINYCHYSREISVINVDCSWSFGMHFLFGRNSMIYHNFVKL